MRTPVIAGNWKMNMTVDQAIELVKGIHYGYKNPGQVDVVVAPPSTSIHPVAQYLKDSHISVAAQNMHWEESGAFTGEISAPFIKDAGADYVIIGHSERRQYFKETDKTVNKKMHSAIKHDLIPIMCVGETLGEREDGRLQDVIQRQVMDGLDGIESFAATDIIIAYEPVWAIGTGKTATSEQAEEVHSFIRSLLHKIHDTKKANGIRILYGGSMNSKHAAELLALPNIDGGLIGGASLVASDFIDIIRS